MRGIIFICVLSAGFAAAAKHLKEANVPTKEETVRIMGGEEAEIEQYPYMSNMEYHWYGIIWSHWCGGSLITPYAVLSAAHCFAGDTAAQWRVRLGSKYINSGGIIHQATRLVIHAQYSRDTRNYDVAIVKLATRAVPSDSIGFARLSSASYSLPDGAPAVTVGWGSLYYGGPYPEELRHVTINIINQELCAERYAYLTTSPDITDRMLCAGILDVGGKDACNGDDGGPLLHQGDIIVGITSWSRGCADEFYPGVSARVSALADWIVQNAL